MIHIIKKYGIRSIWHFTDQVNLKSIIEYGGLYSLNELEKRKINVQAPGGNGLSHILDKGYGLDEYIHLSFLPKHPMLHHAQKDKRILRPFWIRINPAVMLKEGVLFCPEVANKSNSYLYDRSEVEKVIDFEVLFTFMDWSNPIIRRRRKAALKSEILIPKYISIDQIINIPNG